jgi:hypothetical protein
MLPLAAKVRAPLRPFRFAADAARLRELREIMNESPGFEAPAALARLADLPQFVTEVDGARVHFVHVRSEEPDATPLLLTHGALGPFIECLPLLGPLTRPRAYGRRARDAYHVVVPTIPGFGFSGPPPEGEWRAWDAPRVTRAFTQLMVRLGYPAGSFARHTGSFACAEAPPPGLAESPRTLLAWSERLVEAAGLAVDREALLTHVVVAWLTGTAASSARFLLDHAASAAPAHGGFRHLP